jgi:2-polyprenyl-6-methoxyphenol hydroxylase-like FAD-dependent oxidoreductase
MKDIGIIGGGVAGLQLALSLQKEGIPATLYAERTPEQQLACRLSNMVARNSRTRGREQRIGVNHWDRPSHDMVRLAMDVRGARRISFSGRMMAPAHAVDMRMYWATLLEDFAARGGTVVIQTVHASDLDQLAARHELIVVASGRAGLSSMFPRIPDLSPFTAPQRLAMAGLFRGLACSEPRSLEVFVNPGDGEILAVPYLSFEPDVTGIGFLGIDGGRFEPLRHIRYEDSPRLFERQVLTLLREHAPPLFERIDEARFGLARPADLGYAAITPIVRRGFRQLSNTRYALAIGDAHVLIDPITGQGANNASHAADILCSAICAANSFDRAFCERVEQAMCAYSLPVSDAANARLVPATPHFRDLLGAASQHQAVADLYAEGYNDPVGLWAIASSAERTATLLSGLDVPRSERVVVG